jgi:polar amino acid transport system ATP-binding protein
LALNSISKRFGAHQALAEVSLAVEPGEVVAIIGRSGSGKSTLLRCINGLERPDSGTIEFDSKPFEPTPRRLKALRREIGIVFQSYDLFPHLCVERNITLGPTAAEGIRLAAARELRGLALAGEFCDGPVSPPYGRVPRPPHTEGGSSFGREYDAPKIDLRLSGSHFARS